jgi:hypothetical protein
MHREPRSEFRCASKARACERDFSIARDFRSRMHRYPRSASYLITVATRAVLSCPIIEERIFATSWRSMSSQQRPPYRQEREFAAGHTLNNGAGYWSGVKVSSVRCSDTTHHTSTPYTCRNYSPPSGITPTERHAPDASRIAAGGRGCCIPRPDGSTRPCVASPNHPCSTWSVLRGSAR